MKAFFSALDAACNAVEVLEVRLLISPFLWFIQLTLAALHTVWFVLIIWDSLGNATEVSILTKGKRLQPKECSLRMK